MDIQILRVNANNNSITGEMYVNNTFLCHTLELPDRDNTPNISSIPDGNYGGIIRYDKPDGWRIELTNTATRAGIQIHIGNYPSDTKGCILVGDEVYNTENRLANSANAYSKLKMTFYGSENPTSTPDVGGINVTISTVQVEFRHYPDRYFLRPKFGNYNIWTSRLQPDYTNGQFLEFGEIKRDLANILMRNTWVMADGGPPIITDLLVPIQSKGGAMMYLRAASDIPIDLAPWKQFASVTRVDLKESRPLLSNNSIYNTSSNDLNIIRWPIKLTDIRKVHTQTEEQKKSYYSKKQL